MLAMSKILTTTLTAIHISPSTKKCSKTPSEPKPTWMLSWTTLISSRIKSFLILEVEPAFSVSLLVISLIIEAKSGAKHVYGIEKANIYIHSRNIIEENGLSDKITIINGLVQEITLPVDKVDIIISEWMGYFLLYESMFDSVLFARDKWLREGGILMPNKAKMYIAALDDEAYYKKKLVFLNSNKRTFGTMFMVSK